MAGVQAETLSLTAIWDLPREPIAAILRQRHSDAEAEASKVEKPSGHFIHGKSNGPLEKICR
jgi:hypothetical protein